MIDRNTRLIDLTYGDLVDGLAKSEKKSNDRNVTTADLAIELKCSEAQIGIYGRAGMYKHQIKKNCWKLRECEEWVGNEWQEILKKNRTRKIKV